MPLGRPRKNSTTASPAASRRRATNQPQVPFAHKLVLNQWLLSPFLERAGIEKVSDPRFKRYSSRLARLRCIRKYIYRMDVLERSLSYDEVTEIFVRVNSLGAKPRSSDLALAQITAKWRNSLAVFEEFQQRWSRRGFDLDLGLHLKNLIAFTTGQSRFLTVGGL